jgi:heterodisulfide reductase subunit A
MTAEEQAPRIGVYVCHCGGNISDVVDVEKVTAAVANLPGVVVARNYVFMCSDPGQNLIGDDIKSQHLDRVIVAACSPKLHDTTFRGVLQRAGVNPYLYENVNIREQVSWATDNHEQATAKAIALVSAAVAKSTRLEPLDPIRVDTTPRAAVIGGGVAGLRAARDLAKAGLQVALVERKPVLGGNVAILDHLFPNEESAGEVITRLADEVLADERITVYTNATVQRAEGYIGNFTLSVLQDENAAVIDADARSEGPATGHFVPFEGYRLDGHDGNGAGELAGQAIDAPASAAATPDEAKKNDGSEDSGQVLTIEAGAVVVATGYEHYVPRKGEYGYERLPQVITLPDFIKWLASVDAGAGLPDFDGRAIGSVAFIHCVGSRQAEGVNKPQADGKINEYCSRVCCTATLQAICDLHDKRPDVSSFDFYQDIRAYGRGHEEYYEKASKGGAIFVRWNVQEPPTVSKAPAGEASPVLVRCKDGLTWGEEVETAVDLVVLAVGMQPADVSSLIESLKLPVGTDRFLLEVHPKLRPVELAVGGVFVAGTSQGPKDVTETTAAASAAAAKAMTLLSSGHVELDPFVAHVNAERCEAHGLCVTECPYPGAIAMQDYPDGRSRAVVNPALCTGCGACVAVCPTRAIDLAGWTVDEYDAMVDALLEGREVATP